MLWITSASKAEPSNYKTFPVIGWRTAFVTAEHKSIG